MLCQTVRFLLPHHVLSCIFCKRPCSAVQRRIAAMHSRGLWACCSFRGLPQNISGGHARGFCLGSCGRLFWVSRSTTTFLLVMVSLLAPMQHHPSEPACHILLLSYHATKAHAGRVKAATFAEVRLLAASVMSRRVQRVSKPLCFWRNRLCIGLCNQLFACPAAPYTQTTFHSITILCISDDFLSTVVQDECGLATGSSASIAISAYHALPASISFYPI